MLVLLAVVVLVAQTHKLLLLQMELTQRLELLPRQLAVVEAARLELLLMVQPVDLAAVALAIQLQQVQQVLQVKEMLVVMVTQVRHIVAAVAVALGRQALARVVLPFQ
jgi:hypothetical protein